MNVKVREYPQLQQLCWNRPNEDVVDGETAFALYERNWRFVDREAITQREQDLVNLLTERFGNGCLLTT